MKPPGDEDLTLYRNIRRKSLLAILLPFLCVFAPCMASAAACGVVRAGIHISPPFVMERLDGAYSGMAVDLWSDIAEKLELETRYVRYPTVESILTALKNDDIDIAMTNLTVTHERARYVKFTYPWFDSGLRLMVHEDHKGSVLGELRKNRQLRVYAILIALLFFLTILVTLVRRRCDCDFPAKWAEGLSINLYDILLAARGGSITTHYMGWIGNIVSSVWLICGVALVAYVTSTVTAAMTTASLSGGIENVFDLPGKRVAVFRGSAAEEYLSVLGIPTIAYDGIDDAATSLAQREIHAIVADAPVLEYWTHASPNAGVKMTGAMFHNDKYAFATCARQSELADRISVELIRLSEVGVTAQLRLKYFGRHDD